MKKRTAFGRVTFGWPGKHGPGDIKVEFNGFAPSHAEWLAAYWGILRAEDRYDGRGHQGRSMLISLAENISRAQTWNDAKPIVERAAWSVKNRQAA